MFFVGGVRVSSRAAFRPALIAVALAVAALWGMSVAERRAVLARARRGADRCSPVAAALLAVAVGLASTVLGAHVAGGADASGYVSQSRLWETGRLTRDAPPLGQTEWPVRGRLVAPLGYAPSQTADTLGPTYAPGLPWLMALGAVVAGEPARYLWTPLLVAALVWGTFLFARRDAPPAIALSAALLVATSPPVLFAAMQTMSDLPGAALWLGALLALASDRPGAVLASGTLAAVALSVRPNLVFAAGAVWVANIAATGGARRRVVDAVVWAAPVAVAAGAIALLNARVWGSPLASGYGATEDLFRASNVPQNLAALWRWTHETDGYWAVAGAVALAWVVTTGDRRQWWPAAALTVAVIVSYTFYAVFAEWWYLRFYLPTWPVLASAAAVGTWRVFARCGEDAAVLAVMVAVIGIGAGGFTHASAAGTFALWKSEQRYPGVAAFVRDHAPAEAVMLAVQHSGSLAYYADRAIGRWDHVPPGTLDAFCDRLAAAGRPVWLVADDWEEAHFRRRFAGDTRGRLDWAPLGEARVGTGRVRVYDLTTPTRAVGPALIPVPVTSPWPWRRAWTAPTAK